MNRTLSFFRFLGFCLTCAIVVGSGLSSGCRDEGGQAKPALNVPAFEPTVLREERCGNEKLDDGEKCDFRSVGECPEPWGVCWRCGSDCVPYLQHSFELDPAGVFSDHIPTQPFTEVLAHYDGVPHRFKTTLDTMGRRTSIQEDRGDDGTLDASIERRFGPHGLEAATHRKHGQIVLQHSVEYDSLGRKIRDLRTWRDFDIPASIESTEFIERHEFSYPASKTVEKREGKTRVLITTTPFSDPALARVVQKRSERVDRNRDGRDELERVQYLDAQGLLVKRTLDLYRDGIVENVRHYDAQGEWIREDSYSSEEGKLLNTTRFQYQSGELIRRWSTTPDGKIEEDARRKLSSWGRPLSEREFIGGHPLQKWKMETRRASYQRPLHYQRYFPGTDILEEEVVYTYQAGGLTFHRLSKRRTESQGALKPHREDHHERDAQNRIVRTERQHPGVFHPNAPNRSRHRVQEFSYDDALIEALGKSAPKARLQPSLR